MKNARLQELENILTSQYFHTLKSSRKFLSYIVTEELNGNGENLTQQTIAVNALGKPEDFDPLSNPLVRVQAGRLRSHLENYYAGEGKDNTLRIKLYPRNYQPCFVKNDSKTDTNALADSILLMMEQKGIKAGLVLIEDPDDGVTIGAFANELKAGLKLDLTLKSGNATDYIRRAWLPLSPDRTEKGQETLERISQEVITEMTTFDDTTRVH